MTCEEKYSSTTMLPNIVEITCDFKDFSAHKKKFCDENIKNRFFSFSVVVDVVLFFIERQHCIC